MKNKIARPPISSLLFTPGNHPRKVEKVFDSEADSIILDLEDAVAKTEKIVTRDTVVKALLKQSKKINAPAGYVRVNALDTEYCLGDLKTVIGPWLTGIVVPKIESESEIHTIEWCVSQIEHEKGLQSGCIDILPIIETAKGLSSIDLIAQAAAKTRISRITFGAADLTADMRMEWSSSEAELDYVRSSIALASVSAGLNHPIDTVHIRLDDLDGFSLITNRSRGMGFFGKLCIHPIQVSLANQLFTPTADEVKKARRIISAFEKAEKKGSAAIQVDGKFVDYPVVEAAKRTLELDKLVS